jgi:hypothetical protein
MEKIDNNSHDELSWLTTLEINRERGENHVHEAIPWCAESPVYIAVLTRFLPL